MDIYIRDNKIYNLKREMENRKRMLCAKRKELKKTQDDNKFLKIVIDDYDKYNTFIKAQKQQQIVVLERINEYISKITKEMKLADDKLTQAKKDQNEILGEINKITKELDDIILE
jgi:hypothetical protein